jgi:hypothetical protein
MDTAKVEQLARNHKELAHGRDPLDQLDTEAARREETKALERLLHEIERECAEYCASYNEAYGGIRVRSEAHADTVVVRSQLGQQDTIVFRRSLPSHGHAGNLEVHRYHYPEHPVDLPVGVTRAADGTLTLTYRDRSIALADLVLELLSVFSEQIARAERDRANAAARADTTK